MATEKTKAATKGDTTFSQKIDVDILDKIRAIAYWERETIKATTERAFSEMIAKYEKKNGAVKPIPSK